MNAWCCPANGSSFYFHHPSTRPCTILVTSRSILPGARKTAANTRTPRCGLPGALVGLGRIEDGFELFQLLNPILHAEHTVREKAARYRVERYVVAANVPTPRPYTGLGGWTWYTGSSSWMYRLGLEDFWV